MVHIGSISSPCLRLRDSMLEPPDIVEFYVAAKLIGVLATGGTYLVEVIKYRFGRAWPRRGLAPSGVAKAGEPVTGAAPFEINRLNSSGRTNAETINSDVRATTERLCRPTCMRRACEMTDKRRDRVAQRPDPAAWGEDELMSLGEAARLHWPDGPIRERTLRTAVRDGRLPISILACKFFVTRRALAALSNCEPAPTSRPARDAEATTGRFADDLAAVRSMRGR